MCNTLFSFSESLPLVIVYLFCYLYISTDRLRDLAAFDWYWGEIQFVLFTFLLTDKEITAFDWYCGGIKFVLFTSLLLLIDIVVELSLFCLRHCLWSCVGDVKVLSQLHHRCFYFVTGKQLVAVPFMWTIFTMFVVLSGWIGLHKVWWLC